MNMDDRELSGEGPVPAVRPPMADGLRGLGEAVGRAFSKAARSRTVFGFRNHVIAEQARRQIVGPIAEMIHAARESAARAKELSRLGPERELFENVPEQHLLRFIRNAEYGWFFNLVLSAIAAGFVAIGASRDGALGLHTMLGGMLAFLYATVVCLRTARDLEIMRTRRPVPIREFLAALDGRWMALPAGHVLALPSKFLVVPLVATFLISAPILMLERML